jgi:hypothetical protein
MLSLPATPLDALTQVIAPALTHLLPVTFDGPQARVLLLAIALQESGLRTRAQAAGGPARSLWQIEPNGCSAVLANPASKSQAAVVCSLRGITPDSVNVYAAVTNDDVLACALARLILWCDPEPLPLVGDIEGSWLYYGRNWRPGRPRLTDWKVNYQAAQAAVCPLGTGSN